MTVKSVVPKPLKERTKSGFREAITFEDNEIIQLVGRVFVAKGQGNRSWITYAPRSCMKGKCINIPNLKIKDKLYLIVILPG